MKGARLLLLAIPAAALAQSGTPQVSNAQLETRAVSGDALQELREFARSKQGPEWFGYGVRTASSDQKSCCWTNNCAGCRLEGGEGTINGAVKGPVHLEGSSTIFVLYRVANHSIGKVREFSENCPIDVGGLHFTFFTGVSDAASIALLSDQVGNVEGRHEADSSLAAIAQHESKLADQALERFANASQPEWLREKALFWLASARGESGFRVVRDTARNDPNDRIREKTMFDLTLCKTPEATDELIRAAKSDSATPVRKQALFWLSQKAEKKVVGVIDDAARNDPNTEVKKSAVFALQQLPEGEGVPLLIELAKSNSNAEVRKQAMFWLGQSHDKRALDFFEQVLSH